MRRCPQVGFSAARRSTRSGTCRARGSRPERAYGYVQWRATNSRCHRSSVAGVTKKIGQRTRGSSRDSGPPDEGPRPGGASPAARHPWRPCRGRVGPTSAAPEAAAGRPATRSCRHSDRAPNGPRRTKSHVSRMNPVLEPHRAPDARGRDPTCSSRTRHTRMTQPVAGCAAAASLIPSRNGPTRSPAGPPRAATADDHRPSTSRSTGNENVVEGCFNRLEQWRALATRYAKRAALYRSSLLLIAALIWLR